MSESVVSDDARIDCRIDGHIARLSINRPRRRNAVTYAMWMKFGEVLEKTIEDADVRVIVLSGEGELAFSAGNDISEFGQWRQDPDKLADYDARSGRVYRLFQQCDKPTIALIRGVCVGGGLELALLCDLRVAADNARLGITPAKLGLGYKLDDIQLVVDAIGANRAKLLLFTGRLFNAAESMKLGLVNQVVPLAKVQATVDALAEEIAGNAPLTIREVKVAIGEAVKPEDARDRSKVQALVDACHASEDFQEGQKAFREKRKPRFKGS
jgi:enoyl-CoA hydratase/carnithine racemase